MPYDRRGAKNPKWRGGSSGKGVCGECGGPTWIQSVTVCKRCYTKTLGGAGNPAWGKFSSTNRSQGWDRATRRFPLGPCERCKIRPARERHHKDDNPLNNAPDNVLRLCRRCHMIVDGRLARLHPNKPLPIFGFRRGN
jgi:hypothetical protein